MKPIANYTPKQMEEIIGFIEENFGEGEFIAHETESEYVHTDVNISDDETKGMLNYTQEGFELAGIEKKKKK